MNTVVCHEAGICPLLKKVQTTWSYIVEHNFFINFKFLNISGLYFTLTV